MYANLLRDMRQGGATGQSAAREFVQQAKRDKKGLARDVAEQVKELLNRADLRDAFGRDISAQLNSLARENDQPLRDVKTLLPKFGVLDDPRALPGRFAADFMVIRDALLRFPGLTRRVQAERAFEFFAAYAKHFVGLLSGELKVKASGPPVSGSERKQLVGDFEKVLTEAGMADVIDRKTKANGLKVARELLMSAKLAAFKARLAAFRPDAPKWADMPKLHEGAKRPTVDIGMSGLRSAYKPKKKEEDVEQPEAKPQKSWWAQLFAPAPRKRPSAEDLDEAARSKRRLVVAAVLGVLVVAAVVVGLVFLG